MNRPLHTPVILIVFNRPEPTRQVFQAIAKARPARLLIIADGARSHKDGEAELCRQVREIVSQVDWPCEVSTNFSDENLGCDPRVISGLDWAFSLVDEAIILEDDCLADPTFFEFCSEMLERYRHDPRIAAISGTNDIQDKLQPPDSYFFSLLGANWGWATWKDRWAWHDRSLKSWPTIKHRNYLSQLFPKKAQRFWEEIFDQCHQDGDLSPWDYRWVYTRIFNFRLTVVPHVNLIRNIGFGPDATHTFGRDSRRMPELRSLTFPLQHPPCIVWSQMADHLAQQNLYNTFSRKLLRKLRLLDE